MIETVCKENNCNGCMACKDICPKNCIQIKDEIIHYNAIIDAAECIGCNACEKVCPNIAIVQKEEPIEWYQGWTDSNIRSKSSSGGAASAIMNSFIKSGGCVVSCIYQNGQFVFDIADDIETAKNFSGSKYVKSNPSGIYKSINNILKTRKVLFIGLPCQVAALKNYITNQQRLFTIDLICHGTPSPLILSKYLSEMNLDLSQCLNIEFRNKLDFRLSIDGKPVEPIGTDDYTLSFLNAVDYTSNCYSCQFASFERVGDITLGDSWGTELAEEEANGVSLLLIQNEKGKELLRNSDIELRSVDISIAKKRNHQLNFPSQKTKEHDLFFQYFFQNKSIKYIAFKLFKKRVIKREIKKAKYSLDNIVYKARKIYTNTK